MLVQIQGVFDYVVIGVIVLSILFGYFKGFMRTMLSLARFILSTIIAINYSSYAVSIVKRYIIHDGIAEYAAFIIAFIIIFILLSIIKYYVVSLLEIIDQGAVDKLLGLAFGLIRGVLIIAIAYILIGSFTESLQVKTDGQALSLLVHENKLPVWVKSSGLKPQIEEVAAFSIEIMPKPWWEKIEKIIMPSKSAISNDNDGPNNNGNINKEEGRLILRRFPEDFKKIESLLGQLGSLSADDRLKTISEIHSVYMNTISKDVSYTDHKKVLEYFDHLEKQKHPIEQSMHNGD